MRGLDARNTLRVETYGSTFLLFINGRFIDWISDADYASGEVGLFAETLDSPNALIRFDSIIIWNVPTADLDANQGVRLCPHQPAAESGQGQVHHHEVGDQPGAEAHTVISYFSKRR